MANHNTNSSNRVEVTVSGIHDEAKKWFRLSDAAQAMHTRMLSQPAIAMSVPHASRMSGNSAGTINNMYLESYNSYLRLVNGAANEFNAIGNTLNNCADAYEATDGKSAGLFTDTPGS